ncbi:MAG TPA: hypothetical protein VLD38_04050 [Nitrosopumilaceae archaeon]|nr:hypothetical protein [Nitrosopumilaceae archaeon]
MNKDDLPSRTSKKELFAKGSILALIISIPSLTGFFVAWEVLGNLIEAAIVGLVVHFIAMGFALKIAKKIFGKKQ